MIAAVIGIALIWVAIGATAAFVTTSPPRGPAFTRALWRSVRFTGLLGFYMALLIGAGIAILIFSTNPPPPRPETAGMVEAFRYYAFGVVAFLIGAVCHRSIQRFDRDNEK